MAVVIPILGPRHPEPSPYEAFCLARCAMVLNFQDWLKTKPAPSDVSDEIDGTQASMEAFAELAAHGLLL